MPPKNLGGASAQEEVLLRLILIVAAVKGWPVVAGVIAGLAVWIVAVAGTGAAEAGLVLVLGVNQAALVFNARQPGLHVIELGGGDGVFVARRKNPGDLLLRVQDAVWSLGMVGEGLGHQAGFAFFKCLHLLKEGNEGLRIIAGTVHVLDTEEVSLGLEVARELEEGQRHGELG